MTFKPTAEIAKASLELSMKMAKRISCLRHKDAFLVQRERKRKKGDAAAADVFSPHWLPLNGLTLRPSLMKCKRGRERE